MKESFLNLVKENRHASTGSTEGPKQDENIPTPRQIIIKMPKLKNKERILKVAREKKLVSYRGVPIRLSADFSKETCRLEGIGKKYSKT